jgi:hypothetical protein
VDHAAQYLDFFQQRCMSNYDSLHVCLVVLQVVNRMQMLDKGTAQIDWTLRGTFNGAQASGCQVESFKGQSKNNCITCAYG